MTPTRLLTRRTFALSATLGAASLALSLSLTAAESSTPVKKWYKGNTHTHSLWSDGNDFPEMITDWYQKNGYQFLAISDHNVLQAKEVWVGEELVKKRQTAPGSTPALDKYLARFGSPWVETREKDGIKEIRLKKLEEYRPKFERPGEFLLIQAEELSANYAMELKKRVPIHINAINIQEAILPPDGTSIQDVMRKSLQAIHAQGKATGRPVLAHVNHPNFRWALTPEDLAAVLEENFFEIYNGHPMIHYQGDATRPGHETIWDVANTLRLTQFNAPPLYGVGTDDAHHYHGEDSAPGRGWVMVRSESLETDKIIAAMRAGDFYASSGVTLQDVTFKDGVLKVQVEPQTGVTYTIKFVGTPVGFDKTTTTVKTPPDDFRPERIVYSADVGKTFATVEGPVAEYHLKGEELYVRAIITSNRPHPRPSYEDQSEMAWTQPVGWQSRLKETK
ncbi:hypothetical protein [Verrucomicrobium sp. BvORR106]|uniref:hypothetical protein n=1 Tax=Verrucomicrobium sp. BvORR106 TaxID=1403819 RepID=UPI000691534E|nr:hypothetical protein [Verrucomicrobium sp. BvORR106]